MESKRKAATEKLKKQQDYKMSGTHYKLKK
jgi:hypothetical protein